MIRTQKKSACDSCATKSACLSTSDTDMLIEADNPVGAKAGDRVVFSVAASTIMKAGVLLYLVPALCFIAGIVLGQVVLHPMMPQYNQDLVSGVTGVVLLLIAFFAIKAYGRMVESGKSFRPRVLRVVHFG